MQVQQLEKGNVLNSHIMISVHPKALYKISSQFSTIQKTLSILVKTTTFLFER